MIIVVVAAAKRVLRPSQATGWLCMPRFKIRLQIFHFMSFISRYIPLACAWNLIRVPLVF